MVWSGLHATPLKMGLAAYRQFDIYMNYADALHARYVPELHWYLWAIGITVEDYERLAPMYPDDLKEIGGDLGVCVFEFEIWKSICLFDYQFLSVGAVEKEGYLITSLDRLLFLKALGMKESKYHRDLELIVDKVLQVQYDEVHHSNAA